MILKKIVLSAVAVTALFSLPIATNAGTGPNWSKPTYVNEKTFMYSVLGNRGGAFFWRNDTDKPVNIDRSGILPLSSSVNVVLRWYYVEEFMNGLGIRDYRPNGAVHDTDVNGAGGSEYVENITVGPGEIITFTSYEKYIDKPSTYDAVFYVTGTIRD